MQHQRLSRDSLLTTAADPSLRSSQIGLSCHLGARLLGQVPARHRVRSRRHAGLTRRLRQRAGEPYGRRRQRLSEHPHPAAAHPGGAGQRARRKRRACASRARSSRTARPANWTSQQALTQLAQTQAQIPGPRELAARHQGFPRGAARVDAGSGSTSGSAPGPRSPPLRARSPPACPRTCCAAAPTCARPN